MDFVVDLAGAAVLGTSWPLLLGPAAVVALWTRTSRASTDRTIDRIAVAAVALACIAVVVLQPGGPAVVALPLALAGVAAACVDAREGRLPDALTLPLFPSTLAAVGLLAVHDVPDPDRDAVEVLAAALLAAARVAALGLVTALAVKLVSDTLLGWGDVKLAPSLAVVVGHGGSPVVFVATTAIGVALTALLVRREPAVEVIRQRGGRMVERTGTGLVPYGPALVIGALVAAVAGNAPG